MLVVLSPAKKLDFEPVERKLASTSPELVGETKILLETTKKLKAADLRRLMGLSDSLARLNYERFQDFASDPKKASQLKPAAFAFAGDTYVGLEISKFDARDLAFAQDHLRILSGLYGLLKPLDGIQPYRLEMGTKLTTPRGKSLYDFWGDRIAATLQKQAKKVKTNVVVNCASTEYFTALRPEKLKLRIVTPVFKELRGGKPKLISFSAKRARGMMARYIVQNRILEPEGIKDFDLASYGFDESSSSENEWVFLRPDQSRK